MSKEQVNIPTVWEGYFLKTRPFVCSETVIVSRLKGQMFIWLKIRSIYSNKIFLQRSHWAAHKEIFDLVNADLYEIKQMCFMTLKKQKHCSCQKNKKTASRNAREEMKDICNRLPLKSSTYRQKRIFQARPKGLRSSLDQLIFRAFLVVFKLWLCWF